ncbi:alpha/beta hydrolase [Paenarthrobacter sp. NyZ202]|uniref:alpha/beta hydrolase n=1 Tax=Paenarthrobacter sp. NyZ202 TaxID=3402689 RepID=UPI003CF0385C
MTEHETDYTVQEVSFRAEGDVVLRGNLYIPSHGMGPFPALTMSVGYGGVKEHGTLPYAEAFASAGFVVLLHDHRGFGRSEGLPRQDINPWRQIDDWRRAVTYLQTREEVDSERIGLWGSSYSGGHAIVMGATDPRVKVVVSQVPTISGYQQGLRRVPAGASVKLEESFAADELAQLRGEELHRIALVSDGSIPAAYTDPDAVAFYLQPLPDGAWENNVTIRSTRAARAYEPGVFITRVSPTPLMMVVADNDTVTPTDLALKAYQEALPPKELVLFPGGHFDGYLDQFNTTSSAALRWFKEHLSKEG